MIINSRIRIAAHYLKKGVIAHPTDTIYGLGCLANNAEAMKKIINLKKRDNNKGFILLASNISFGFRSVYGSKPRHQSKNV